MSEKEQGVVEAGGGDWVGVGTYPTADEAFDHALVALAMGEAVRVEYGADAGEFDLQAEADAASKITRELEEYREEEAGRVKGGKVGSDWSRYPAGFWVLGVWVGVLLWVFFFQMRDGSLVVSYASSSIDFVDRGEWWRPFTALFLHGDGLHLAGNVATGGIFGLMVSKCVGPLRGWGLILLCGAVGNATTSLVTYPEPFVSLGASTAVFSALGILSGIGLVENLREDLRMPWVSVMAPVIAGVILLGWWGGAEAGSNTDVFGHVFGFMAGVLGGGISRYVMRDEIEALHGGVKRSN